VICLSPSCQKNKVSVNVKANRTLWMLLVLLGALASCSSAPDDTALFPLEAGRSWTYQVATVTDDPAFAPPHETLVFKTHGAGTAAGEPAWRRRSSTGAEYWLRRRRVTYCESPTRWAPNGSPVPRLMYCSGATNFRASCGICSVINLCR
jgi:hypothetical protein